MEAILLTSEYEEALTRPGYPRPYANPSLNSRVAASLPAGRWEVQWQAKLDAVSPYPFVLQSGERAVLQGPDGWILFDLKGVRLAAGRRGDSDVVLDEARSLMYMADPYGRIASLSLTDAAPVFVHPVRGTDDYKRTFLAVLGDYLVVTSYRRHTNPHSAVAPTVSAAEVYRLGADRVVEDGILMSSELEADTTFETERLYAALSPEGVVLALRDRILLDGMDLSVRSRLEGSFTPLALSTDEKGQVYVVVRTRKEGTPDQRALWIVSAAGERMAEVELPEIEYDAYQPPIVGYDGTVFILLEKSVRAIGPDGTVLWDEHIGAPVTGAVALEDRQLLVTAGPFIVAFDPQGERTILFQLEGDRWTTPAIVTEEGKLLAASERHLHLLAAKL